MLARHIESLQDVADANLERHWQCSDLADQLLRRHIGNVGEPGRHEQEEKGQREGGRQDSFEQANSNAVQRSRRFYTLSADCKRYGGKMKHQRVPQCKAR